MTQIKCLKKLPATTFTTLYVKGVKRCEPAAPIIYTRMPHSPSCIRFTFISKDCTTLDITGKIDSNDNMKPTHKSVQI